MCPRIFDSTAAGTDLQATSIAISDDKQFAVAGHSNGPNASGGFYVYANNGGQWQQQFTYKGTPGSRMGSKVAISGDGNTIVVGGGSGTFPVFDSLWIFNKNGLQWQMQFAGLMRASNLCLLYDGKYFFG